ncbi:MAG TPA: hypothetical protein VIV40_33310 [Kofleriaceae bacterium]
MRLAALALVLTSTAASADGFYYSQSYGVSSARGDGAAPLGESLQLRIALGWRFGAFTVGPVMSGNLAVERDNAYFGFVGGDPTMGDSDLKTYGLDARYHANVHDNLVMYVRGGPRYASALGALDGYSGFGVGAGTGIQLTGRVRALGFLFAPMFFMKKGPLITASVFLDESVEWYRLDADRMPQLSMPLVGTSIGIAAGSHF